MWIEDDIIPVKNSVLSYLLCVPYIQIKVSLLESFILRIACFTLKIHFHRDLLFILIFCPHISLELYLVSDTVFFSLFYFSSLSTFHLIFSLSYSFHWFLQSASDHNNLLMYTYLLFSTLPFIVSFCISLCIPLSHLLPVTCFF